MSLHTSRLNLKYQTGSKAISRLDAGTVATIAKTDGLEVTLASFETALKIPEVRPFTLKDVTNYESSVRVALTENQKYTGNEWRVESASVSSACGESRDSIGNPDCDGAYFILHFNGSFWTEEPAWKLRVKISRKHTFRKPNCGR